MYRLLEGSILRCRCRLLVHRAGVDVLDFATATVDDDSTAALALWYTIAGSSKVEDLR